MEFIKGTMMGMIGGMVVGIMKKKEIMKICNTCKKKMHKFKKFSFSF